jgi:hypothetical protein
MYDVCGIKFYTFGKAILGKAILKAWVEERQNSAMILSSL